MNADNVRQRCPDVLFTSAPTPKPATPKAKMDLELRVNMLAAGRVRWLSARDADRLRVGSLGQGRNPAGSPN